MTMTRECSDCGEEFNTLTKKRLHECPTPSPGPSEWIEESTEGMDLDEISERLADELYQCVSCGANQSDARYAGHEVSNSGIYFAVEFVCDQCGQLNENEAEVE